MSTKKVIPIKPLTSWSFSRYSTYKQCPLKARYNFIDKINEPPNAAMERGTQIHNLAEDFVKGKISKLPPELKLFDKDFKALKTMFKKVSQSMVVEDTWAFTKDWEETAWNNWTACYVRIKLDCAHHENDDTLIVTDWKTGKFRVEKNEEYVEQLELYALAALLLHPHLKAVKPRLGYLDQGIYYPRAEDAELVFTRDDIPKLQKLWNKRVKPMMNDTIFAPRPNNNCHWCWYGQSKKAAGGPGLCKY
jgi:CRISPR/Cas system-associated exonuclease Cas4 (RecB family)